MISVAIRMETAARIKYSFDRKKIHIDELTDPARTLHIDSKVLDEAESDEELIPEVPSEPQDEGESDGSPEPKLTKKQQAELLRRQVDTVGQRGQPGEKVQNVISVGMLSEGWDAKTVTHIMGLRAFSSQLLCEQVVGRGLRRTGYDLNPETGLFDPEYVNIFGVPFTFLPHETGEDGIPPPPTPKTTIEPDPAKQEFAISWPNVLRIDRVYRPHLTLDWEAVAPLELDASLTPRMAELAPIVEGKPDLTKIAQIDLENLAREFRTQKIVFEVARDNYDAMQNDWKGSKEILLAQLIRLVEEFIRSEKIVIRPLSFQEDDLKRRLVITLNMSKVVNHIGQAIRFGNTEKREIVFDRDHPFVLRETWELGTPEGPAKELSAPISTFASSIVPGKRAMLLSLTGIFMSSLGSKMTISGSKFLMSFRGL